MPKLNEYIGSLVSSITNARIMSDIQTVKVAEEYANHHLLKYFSVPRLRIDDVEMTIPIVLEEIDEKIETVYEPIDNTKFNALVYNELVNSMGLTKLPNELSLKLRSTIAKRTQLLEQNLRITKDLSPLKNFSREITAQLSDLEKTNPDLKGDQKRKLSFKTMPDYLEKTLSKEIKVASQIRTIENLNVIAEGYKLKEQKPENIIYIKLKISEDSMEWSRSETSDGELETKLIPE
jgi:hypothetical protein